MRHFASPSFWAAYDKLPPPIRALADRNYALLKENRSTPRCTSRKPVGSGPCAPASATAPSPSRWMRACLWFWIGSHADYDFMIG